MNIENEKPPYRALDHWERWQYNLKHTDEIHIVMGNKAGRCATKGKTKPCNGACQHYMRCYDDACQYHYTHGPVSADPRNCVA